MQPVDPLPPSQNYVQYAQKNKPSDFIKSLSQKDRKLWELILETHPWIIKES